MLPQTIFLTCFLEETRFIGLLSLTICFAWQFLRPHNFRINFIQIGQSARSDNSHRAIGWADQTEVSTTVKAGRPQPFSWKRDAISASEHWNPAIVVAKPLGSLSGGEHFLFTMAWTTPSNCWPPCAPADKKAVLTTRRGAGRQMPYGNALPLLASSGNR